MSSHIAEGHNLVQTRWHLSVGIVWNIVGVLAGSRLRVFYPKPSCDLEINAVSLWELNISEPFRKRFLQGSSTVRKGAGLSDIWGIKLQTIVFGNSQGLAEFQDLRILRVPQHLPCPVPHVLVTALVIFLSLFSDHAGFLDFSDSGGSATFPFPPEILT